VTPSIVLLDAEIKRVSDVLSAELDTPYKPPSAVNETVPPIREESPPFPEFGDDPVAPTPPFPIDIAYDPCASVYEE
jgi:hypothetical protein